VLKGNWDSWYFKDLDRFGSTGAKELTSQALPLRVRGTTIWIGGLPVGSKSSVKEAMTLAPATAYRIFHFHYPDYIEEMRNHKIDLYLAGHTHGG
jgi:predicted MPP superfamily phosphohydrolase